MGWSRDSNSGVHLERITEDGLRIVDCLTGSQAMMFFAIYRAVHNGVPVDAALEAARRGGMTPGQTELVRAQVARLLG